MKLKPNKKPAHYKTALISKPLTVLWIGGILALIVVSLIPHAGISEIDSGFGKDKIARIIVFLILAFYPAAFFSSIRWGLMTSTSIAPLGFLLELAQRYVPGRHFSPGDLIANNVGAVVGILLALVIRFFFRTGQRGFRPKASALKTPVMDTESESAGDEEAADEAANTSKRMWKSRFVIFFLLLVIVYIVWEVFMQHNPGRMPEAPFRASPAKTAVQEEAPGKTGPDHPAAYRPQPGVSERSLPGPSLAGNHSSGSFSASPGGQPQNYGPQPEVEDRTNPEAAHHGSRETFNPTDWPLPGATLDPESISTPDFLKNPPSPSSETGLQTSPGEPLSKKKTSSMR